MSEETPGAGSPSANHTMKKNAKFTTETWAQIRVEYEAGVSQKELAKRYSLNQTTIMRRRKREGWGTCGSGAAALIVSKREEILKKITKSLEEAAFTGSARHVQLLQRVQELCKSMLGKLGNSLAANKKIGKEPYLMQCIMSTLNMAIALERDVLGLTGEAAKYNKEKTPLQELAESFGIARKKAGLADDDVGGVDPDFEKRLERDATRMARKDGVDGPEDVPGDDVDLEGA